MHDTAFKIGSQFLNTYATLGKPVIVELGAYNYNGSLRDSCPKEAIYVGLDVEHGPGVDIVIKPQHPLPLRDGFADLVVSSSQMEHDPRFWVTFLELCRITKDGGAIFLNAPSNGSFHSYPVDVYRFYPDAGKALASWASDNNQAVVLWESFTAARSNECWNDFIAIFHKGDQTHRGPAEFIFPKFDCWNVWMHGQDTIVQVSEFTEDMMIIHRLKDELASANAQIRSLKKTLEGAGMTAGA